jgi:putative membrane protein
MKYIISSLKAAVITSFVLTGLTVTSLPVLAQSSPMHRVEETDSSSSSPIPIVDSPETLRINSITANLDNQAVINLLHHMNKAEIDVSTKALQRLESQQARDFTQTIINHHQQSEESVTRLASEKGWKIVEFHPSTVDVSIESLLQGLTGSSFDIAFLRVQLMEHEKALQNLKLMQDQALDPDLEKLINDTIPIIQNHIDLANTDLNLIWQSLGTAVIQ